MLSFLGKLLPYGLVRFIIRKFGKNFATLQLGNKQIKGKFWSTGTDEGFFISDLSEMKNVAQRQKDKLQNYEEKIRRLEEQESD